MQAEFTLELGAESPCLELPWAAHDGSSRFYDLRAQPELLLQIGAAAEHTVLGEFLATLNMPHGARLLGNDAENVPTAPNANGSTSPVLTAKCDTWTSSEIYPEEEVFGAAMKFASYVDLFFTAEAARFDFAEHERFAQRLCALLGRAPEIAASAELFLRRCYYHRGGIESESDPGFYLTLYVTGFGDEPSEAELRWSIAMKVVQNAILQLGAMERFSEAGA